MSYYRSEGKGVLRGPVNSDKYSEVVQDDLAFQASLFLKYSDKLAENYGWSLKSFHFLMFYISKTVSNEFQQDHSQMTECPTLGEFVLGDVKIPLSRS